MAQYGKIEYWNERYTVDTEPFDWYQRYSGIRHFFTEEYMAHDPSTFPPRGELRVLVIGCGNSRLSEEMLEDGFGSVTSIDFSPVVIDQMTAKYPKSKYEVMDLTKKLSYADGSFDLIVCKGTLDAILCGSGSMNNAITMFTECSRVLTDAGAVLVVSYGTPDNRMVYLKQKEFEWTVDTHTVPKPRLGIPAADEKGASSGDHFVYVCKKGSPPEIKEVNVEEERTDAPLKNPDVTQTDDSKNSADSP